MLKILIKKQFKECFRNYFINTKTGKAKSKAAIIGVFALFAFIMLSLGVCFLGLATGVVDLLKTQYSWLYYALFAMITIGLGTFASVFNTSSSLYKARDNDLLLSMPIKPAYILISRISLVYGLSLMYSSMAWIPICLLSFFISKFNISVLIIDLILLIVITIFTTVLSCLLGYIIAKATGKAKRKSLITVLITVIFMGAYYFVCFRLQNILESILLNSEKIANIFSTYGYFIYQLALAAEGNIISLIIIIVINLILGYVCYRLLARSYTKIITSSNNVKSQTKKITYSNKSSIDYTLLKKEAKRFVETPIYLLNCGLGVVFVLVIAVASLIKQNDIYILLDTIKEFLPEVNSFIPLLIIGTIGLVIGLNNIATPSISLEGKNLWVLKSLPIDTYRILNAKKKLQLLVNVIPSIIASLIMCYAFKLDLLNTTFVVIVIYFFEEIHSCIGILLALVNPNFVWTNETQPVKQDVMILVAMFISLVIILASIVPYYFYRQTLPINEYLQVIIIFMAAIIVILRRLIRSWGIRRFEAL